MDSPIRKLEVAEPKPGGPWWRPSPGVVAVLLALCGMCSLCFWEAGAEQRAKDRAASELSQGRTLEEAILAIDSKDRRFAITLSTVPKLDPPRELRLDLRGEVAAFGTEGVPAGPGDYRPLGEALEAFRAEIAPLTTLSYEGQAYWAMSHDLHAVVNLKLSSEGVLTKVGGL